MASIVIGDLIPVGIVVFLWALFVGYVIDFRGLRSAYIRSWNKPNWRFYGTGFSYGPAWKGSPWSLTVFQGAILGAGALAFTIIVIATAV